MRQSVCPRSVKVKPNIRSETWTSQLSLAGNVKQTLRLITPNLTVETSIEPPHSQFKILYNLHTHTQTHTHTQSPKPTHMLNTKELRSLDVNMSLAIQHVDLDLIHLLPSSATQFDDEHTVIVIETRRRTRGSNSLMFPSLFVSLFSVPWS